MGDKRALAGIQYLRGICAVAVVCTHVASMAAYPKYFGQTFLSGMLEHGAQGVDIFFVISGFIITMVALKADDFSPRVARGDFLANRFSRIVPLMWVAVMTHAALRLRGATFSAAGLPYLRAMSLVPFGSVEPTVIWTLRNELIFYAVFAIAWLGPKKFRPLLCLWIFAPIIIAAVRGGAAMEFSRSDPLTILFSSANLEFGAGMVVGLLWLRRRDPIVLAGIHPFLATALLAAATLALGAISPFPWLSVGNTAQFAVTAGGLVYFSSRLATTDDRLSRFGALMGDASFSIYLFHFHIATPVLTVWAHFAHHTPLYIVVTGTVVAAVAAGVLIHLIVEKPLIRAVRSLLSRHGRLMRKQAAT